MKTPIALLIAFTPFFAFADEVIVTLIAPTRVVSRNSTVEIAVVAMNAGAVDAPFNPPVLLSGSLSASAGLFPVTLKAVGNASTAIRPGSFAVRHYEMSIPAEVSGRAVLDVSEATMRTVHAVFDIDDGTSPSTAVAVTPFSAIAPPVASLLTRSFAGRFTPNQPVYAVYGPGVKHAGKFQFSFDYRLATITTPEHAPNSITTLRFGYTQRSIWDIDHRSSPFYDTSYMPEFVLNVDAPSSRQSSTRLFNWMGLRTGLQHESNGRDGEGSRSLNYFYFRPRFVIGEFQSWLLAVLPEIQAYVGSLGDNPHISEYRDYGRLRVYLGKNEGPTLMLSAWSGRGFQHGTVQLDLAVPFRSRLLNMESFGVIQYFSGYGESLRAYEERSDSLRVGIGLVR